MQFLINNILSAVMLLAGIFMVFVWKQTIPDQIKLKQVSGKVISIETIQNRGKVTAIGLSGVDGLFIFYYGHACKVNGGLSKIELLHGQYISIEYQSEIRRRYFQKNVVNTVYSLVSNSGYACTYKDIDAENKRSNSNVQFFGYLIIIWGFFLLLKKPKTKGDF